MLIFFPEARENERAESETFSFVHERDDSTKIKAVFEPWRSRRGNIM